MDYSIVPILKLPSKVIPIYPINLSLPNPDLKRKRLLAENWFIFEAKNPTVLSGLNDILNTLLNLPTL